MVKQSHLEMVISSIEFIEHSLLDPITVPDVCKHIAMSAWEFQRLFRALVGDSIGSYIRGRRLTRAAEILIESRQRIIEVAIDFQFGSQEAFTRAFRKQYSVTPGYLRKHPEFYKIHKKPTVSRELLNHIIFGIEKQPKIQVCGPLKLVGVDTQINSFLGDDPDFVDKLPQFWKSLYRSLGEHFYDHRSVLYGVALCESERLFENSLRYFGGIPWTTEMSNPPEGYQTCEIPEKQYAIFENIGLADKSRATIDYIYGIWLPQSGYKRSRGFDFETFDKRYQFDNPNSISNYYIPIEK